MVAASELWHCGARIILAEWDIAKCVTLKIFWTDQSGQTVQVECLLWLHSPLLLRPYMLVHPV
jgi:hypothetical protein